MEVNIARIIQKANLEDPGKALPDLDAYRFRPEMIIELFPGPALMVNANLEPLHHNIHASGLIEALHHKAPALNSLVMRCLNNNCPEIQKTTLQDSKGQRHYQLCALPARHAHRKTTRAVLILGRETTVDHNLTTALVDSRQMFKDLVSCSTDLSWETDSHGRFKYVSPRGILGYTAHELTGKSAADLIIDGEGKNPFDSLDMVQNMELWVQRSDGSTACLQVSAVPVIDNQARWQGARGVCRDITARRESDSALRKIRRREHVLGRIVGAIRDLADPQDMLTAILDAGLDGIRAGYFAIVELTAPDINIAPQTRLRAGRGPLEEPGLQETICRVAAELGDASRDRPSRTARPVILDGASLLVALTSCHHRLNGALVMVRETAIPESIPESTLESALESAPEWTEDDITLFTGIASHMGIALDQLRAREALVRLSGPEAGRETKEPDAGGDT